MGNPGRPLVLYNVTNTPLQVRSCPVTVVGGYVYNTGVADGVLLLFDKLAAQVTLGTTQPDYVIRAFSGSSIDICRAAEGVMFTTGLTIAMVDSAPTGTAARTGDVHLIIQ